MSDTPVTDIVEPTPLILETVDIQHDTDPAQNDGPVRRIPHLGHAVLFFSLAFFFINLCALLVFTAFHLRVEQMEQHPALALAAQALSYVATMLTAFWLFPRLWQRSFLLGIQWNVLAARRRWYWLVGGGVLLSAVVQLAMHFITQPPNTPIEEMMRTKRGAWSVIAFAVLLAPVVEEIAFRGFLLPAMATAYDWLALERSPAGMKHWENTTIHSISAIIFATVFSSIPFILLHAPQVAHAWSILGVLYGVSVVLSFVRIRTHSVACSTLLHLSYNLSVFVAIFLT